MNIQDYILIVDDALEIETCNRLIELYDSQITFEYKERYDREKKPNFTQFNFTKYKNLDPELHRLCEISTIKAIDTYKENVPDAYFFPENYGYEQYRIKHYDHSKQDMFDTHVDCLDIASSKRFLIFYWYLNDVEEGGETLFDNLNYEVKPKAGRLVMFPPYWMYPHTGKTPISNSKYLLSSQLNFVE
jgi:hypothetical protein